jgi:hypothetical protein
MYPRRTVTLIAVFLLVILTAGCAAPVKKTNYDDLNYFRIDCRQKSEQIRFLESQMPTRDEYMLAGLTVTSIIGYVLSQFNGTYEEKRHIYDRSYQAVIRSILWDLRTYCP